MRILVVGAGSIGGYFGGRLLEAGRDVTFLVRPRRAGQLAETGLCLRSPAGDYTLPNPATVLADTIPGPFDIVLLSCKAYDLDGAIESLAPAVGEHTIIVPLLNGMAHLDTLDARFGAARIAGGLALISTVLDAEGRVLHLNAPHGIVFGARSDSQSDAIAGLAAAFEGTKCDARASSMIMQEMWEKWVTISTAQITCLMRSAIGDIVEAGGAPVVEALIADCAAIATAQGFPPREAMRKRVTAMFTTPGSLMTSSMARDMEAGNRVESEQILGDLLRRAGDLPAPTLRMAYIHLKSYEARRARETA